MASDNLADLAAQLERLIQNDLNKVRLDINACLTAVNSESQITPRSAAYALRRLCGQEPTLWFEIISATLMFVALSRYSTKNTHSQAEPSVGGGWNT